MLHRTAFSCHRPDQHQMLDAASGSEKSSKITRDVFITQTHNGGGVISSATTDA